MNRALINASSGIVQKPLRYVFYVRKSSEDAEAQAKSLPDQIADCKEYANKKMQEKKPLSRNMSYSARKRKNNAKSTTLLLVRNMVSNLDKTRRRAKIKCLHFIFRDDEVFSRREIDAQKKGDLQI